MRAAIFDFDGVLVNSEPAHFIALREALRPEGVVISEIEYLGRYVAYDDRRAAAMALEHHGRPAPPDRVRGVAERKASLYEELLREVPFFPGARELVRGLQERMPLAIASGARHVEIEEILDKGGLRDAFAAVVGADDVRRTKPDPEPYLEALRQLRRATPDLEASQCMALEDTPPGIAAARGAGMIVIGVAHTYDAPRLAAAHRVVESLREVSAEALLALAAEAA
jgi:HAD superfamily hydrolase (TIGR01509 family)